MKDINIEINVCDSTGKATCTVHPPVCCHSDNGSGQEPGVSGVTSVFGRTGVVTAQPGDYMADQITETATREFASPDEKATWNAKQDALISGTSIRTLFGQSLLSSGDFSPTPEQMGVATAEHTHITADITDYTQKTKQLIHSSLGAGAGVTLSYNPVNEKTIISAAGGSGSGGSGYIVADRQGATAGQNHAFSISPQNTFNLAAYALKEEAGAANQTYVVDDFNASSEPNYNATNAVIWDGKLKSYTGELIRLKKEGDLYSSPVRADGVTLSISQLIGSIVPAMTSNVSPLGYVASASSEWGGVSNPAWLAFDGRNNGPNCWATQNAVSPAAPGWLMVSLPVATPIDSYTIKNRFSGGQGNPRTWELQGSNDGTVWDKLHSVSNDTNNAAGSVRHFQLQTPANYSSYRIWITEQNGSVDFCTIGEFELFSHPYFLIRSAERWFSAQNGVLTQVASPSDSSEFHEHGFSNSGIIDGDELGKLLPIQIVSDSASIAVVSYTPSAQIAVMRSSISTASWSKINAAAITATQTGNGKVRVAVTRDLVNWHVLRNGGWVDVGALSADTAGAEALIVDGMTPAELGGITTAQWAQLFASNNGVPDSLAFAFALDITDPVADVAAIDRLVLNVNDASSWKVQSSAEVEIRWRTDSVTFRTATAGNYKLAYQIP
ncbi:discoidin domain-containing protein [Pectobacterium brasiliense]|uniref:discoidin domain-containing protein n=1 Tax=Pectobacterium brasiliense TaxID=180957 RepID=UPI0015DED06F|nr:discoidin domain-containing protein [Pectobacterium brasiliense]MBA0211668.1 discoidin domain-containing protein [Pectobacterium brasiliense]